MTYDSKHFCPSWCKCCAENLLLKPVSEETINSLIAEIITMARDCKKTYYMAKNCKNKANSAEAAAKAVKENAQIEGSYVRAQLEELNNIRENLAVYMDRIDDKLCDIAQVKADR